ncbi:MAG: DEAD/DEAH box helicase [Chlamydiales bacterium]|nr:DEAD/DEAH box helicase [Chlamydiales bacterium]
MEFKDLVSNLEVLKAIEELGHKQPTPIQEQAIPEIMKGTDIRGSAQTGTGKTAAFLLPVLMRLAVPSALPGKGPRALILVPTRELAAQVANEAKKYSKYLSRAKTVCIYGGTPYPPQYRELSRPFDILIATPGRLIDHFEQKRIDFSRVEMFILDEADRMLDMGFIEPVEMIAAALPATRQTLLFSATLKGSVMNLSRRLLKDPVEICIEAMQANHENIDQVMLSVDSLDHKYRLLEHMLKDPKVSQAVVFTATKHQADQLANKLSQTGLPVAALHGGMKQRQRTNTIMQLRRNQVSILIATDVAARGIDIPTISHVFNFDLPNGIEDYVHRIGRTGRAGALGTAFSFVKPNEFSFIKRVERYTGQKIRTQVTPGFEPRERQPQREPSSDRPNSPYRQNNKRPFKPAGAGGPFKPAGARRDNNRFARKRPR